MKPELTVFEYLYRDAGNYKSYGSVLLSGTMPAGKVQCIRDACESETYFIAEQIGLDALHQELYQYSSGPTEDDHVFHEFLRVWERPRKPDEHVWGSASDLVERFARARGAWNYSLSPHWRVGFWS